MSTRSARDTALGGILAAALISFLIGICFILGVQRLARHDAMSILFLLLVALMIFAAVLNVRRILRAIP
jgi:hypothetical protein